MSVSIKLSRVGAKNNPIYRVVAAATKSKRDGKNLEVLGFYDPRNKWLKLDKEKLSSWIKKGAIVTNGVKKVTEKEVSK